MKLLALVDGPEHVCYRYRLGAYRPYLEKAGHALEWRKLPKKPLRRALDWLPLASALRHADAVVLQRQLLHPVELFLLRRLAARLIYDFDDAIYMHDSYDRRGLYSPTKERRFVQTMRLVDTVIAGNDYLAERARLWTGNKPVHVVPTCVDAERYPCARHLRQGHFTELVWIGSASTLQGIERIGPLLERVGERYPGIHLKVICDRFPTFPRLPVKNCMWRGETEASELAAADVGVSWLPDDPWSRGKCGLKVLQYMAAGLPVVANPVGVQVELVQHGQTGFLANSEREWVEAIGRLTADPELRRRMGEAGRRRLEQQFSVPAGATQWIQLLDGLRPAARAA